MLVKPYRIESEGNYISFMKTLATSINALSGHLWNQFSDEQLTKEGNIRHLTRSLPPMGLMHKIKCSFYWILLMNKFQRDYPESGRDFLAAIGRIIYRISSISSFFVKRPGTYPVLSILLISYRKDYEVIWTSVRIKQIGLFSEPVRIVIFCRSALKLSIL